MPHARANSPNSSSAPRHIPGFYWDSEKSRYFKIAHASSGGQYTASAVAKRRRTEAAALEREVAERSRAKPSLRSKGILYTSRGQTHGMLVDRSLGSSTTKAQQGLWAKRLHSDPKATRLLDIARQRSKLAYDAETQTMYIASSRFISSHSMCQEPERELHRWLPSRHTIPVSPLRSAASSLSYHSQMQLLLGTTLGDGDRPAEIFLGTPDGGRLATVDSTLWCSASHPDQSQVVAAGGVVLLYDCSVGEGSRTTVRMRKGVEVMSTDFLDTHVIALGCRSGEVNLHDVRTDSACARPRFTHNRSQNAAIAKIKALNPFQLLISGLRSTLALYDTRFLKDDKALVSYEGHKNMYDFSTNSLDTNGRVVAVAQATKGHGFALWHLSGEMIGNKQTKSCVDDLLFRQSAEGHDQKLWTICSGVLEEWIL